MGEQDNSKINPNELEVYSKECDNYQCGKEEMKRKAIKAACNYCIQLGGGCGHIDREDNAMMYCKELEYFIQELNTPT